MSIKSYVMPSDMSDLCRVCLQLPEESQYLDLTTIYDEDDNLTYGECFSICTQIDLSAGEGVPHNLCKTCGLELQMSYDFYKKIEESNRVIEQYQKQTKLQGNTAEQTKTFNLDDEEDQFTDEEQLPEPTELSEDECVIQEEDAQEFVATANVIDEIDVDICGTEANTHQIPVHKNNLSLETINAENKIIVQDQLEVEYYQNLETLEEEETETLQINCDENTIPIHVTKIKTLKSGENEEFFEYTEVYDDDDEEEEERDELDKEYAHETHEPKTDERLRWQDNVVAVANKEHLPIVVDDDCVEEGEEEIIYETTKFKSNEIHVIVNDSSQDEAIYDENETTDDAISQTAKTKSNTNKNINNNNNSTERKRHVGSYSCDYCHRVYPNYSRMKNHRRCHEADRPKFSCSHCGRLYATKQARDCHIQTAHDKSGYTCSICSKVFAIRKSLEIHVRYHTGDFPYACKLCDRKFAQACHLNTHINVKHNQIRFSCDYPNCGKYFTSSSSLRNHEFTHGIMPFECEYCQQGYPAKSKLRIHIQRKHGIDMNTEQLEKMRKFHVMRSKVNLVQFVDT